MKKLLLMVVCLAGLACFNVSANETYAPISADQTVQLDETVNVWLTQASDGWYLNVTGNSAPIYVVIDGPETAAYHWYVPAGGTEILVYSGDQFVTIAEWYYA